MKREARPLGQRPSPNRPLGTGHGGHASIGTYNPTMETAMNKT